MATDISGSWFNSGYHGHFRSKSRTDFLCEYRHLAKPIPPKDFVKKSKANVVKHAFSHHDNRNSFMNDALYFEQGLGRRRIRNNTNRYQQDLLDWHPEKEEFTRTGPRLSVYKVDYHSIPVSDTYKQKITKRPKTSFDDNRLTTTSYRYAHCADNPNKGMISAQSNIGLSTVSNRRQKGSFISGRESVATCLNWYSPQTGSTAPESTQMDTTVHIPHPPDVQKPSMTTPPQTVTAPQTAPAGPQVEAL